MLVVLRRYAALLATPSGLALGTRHHQRPQMGLGEAGQGSSVRRASTGPHTRTAGMRTLTTPRMEQDTKTSAEPELRLVLPSRAENVALVRRALSGVVDVLELGEARLLDINAAVSEACNNVVVHAYEGTEGPMDVYLCDPADRARGDRQRSRSGHPAERAGARPRGSGPRAVADPGADRPRRVPRRHGRGHQGPDGLRLRRRPEALPDGDRADGPEVRPPPGELSIAVSSGPLAAPVLGRVIAMLAARAEFSLEGISEAELVTDAVAAHAPRAIVGNRIQLGIDRPDGQLVVRVGPLAEGGATRVIQASALDDLPPVLERLTEHAGWRAPATGSCSVWFWALAEAGGRQAPTASGSSTISKR